MRRVLPVLLALVCSLGIASRASASAIDPAEAQPASRGESPLPADDFVVAIAADVQTLDPAFAVDTTSLLVASQIYDTLVDYEDGGSRPVLGLAQGWTVSPDGLIWTFYLRPGVRFQDGTPADASAVEFNLLRWWDKGHPYHEEGFLYFEALFGGFKGDPNCLIAGVSANGEDQVQVTLTRPYSAILGMLAVPAFSIASPAAIQAGTLAAFPVGSGPFAFVERVPGVRIGLRANAGYWAGPPRSAALTFLVMQNAEDRLRALLAGTVQSADYAAGAEGYATLRVLGRPATVGGYLGINWGRVPLANPLVRQAIAYAIDKQHLLDTVYGEGFQKADQFLPPGIWGRAPNVDYTYNPVQACSLLTEAGYSNGFTTTLAYGGLNGGLPRPYLPHPKDAAEAIAEDLADLDCPITATVVEYEWSDFVKRVGRGELDLFLLGWSADFLHPDNFFSPHFCGWAGLGPADAELCDNLAAALLSPDLATQESIYEWASRRVHDTARLVPLVHVGSAIVIRYDVTGVKPSPMGTESYKDARVAGAAYTTVTPAAGGSLAISDAQGGHTSIQAPPGAVTGAVQLNLVEADVAATTPNLVPTGHAFDLDASLDGAPLPGMIFTAPITVTVDYADADLAGTEEALLRLYYWDGSAWTDAATTCSPASQYLRDPGANRLRVQVCHLSRFALLGKTWTGPYLPMIRR